MTRTLIDPLGRLITAVGPEDDGVEVLQRLASADLVAVDVETTGTAWTDRLRTIQLGSDREAVVLRADLPQHCDAVAGWLAATTMPLTAHNAGFDIGFLARSGIAETRPLWERMVDTLILDALLRPGDGWTAPEHGLKPATAVWCGAAATAADAKTELRRWWKSLGLKSDADGWRDCPVDGDPYLLYGAADVFDGATLAHTLLPLVDGLIGREVREREHRVARLLHGITMRGLRVDTVAARADAAAAAATVAARRRELVEHFGVANPNSGTQVAAWFAERGVDLPNTQEATLSGLNLTGDAAAFRDALLAYKALAKIESTYLRRLAATPADPDGVARLHPTLGSLDARTGRMASRDPNMQNFPAEVRRYIVAEPGMTLVGADFSAVEVRVAAALAEDAALVSAFAAGRDPYVTAGEAAWGTPRPEEAKAQRNRAKPLLLGHIYGRGANSVATAVGVGRDEAQLLQDRLNAAMPDMPRFVAESRARVAAGATTTRLPSGRVVQVHPATQHTAAVNTVVQGTGRDLIVEALIALDDAGLGDAVWLPIHDEWILQVPEADAEAAREALEQTMTQKLGQVDIIAEAEVMGSCWAKL